MSKSVVKLNYNNNISEFKIYDSRDELRRATFKNYSNQYMIVKFRHVQNVTIPR